MSLILHMRTRGETEFDVRDGLVVCFDPMFAFAATDVEPFLQIPTNVPFFDNFGGDGSFNVYRSPECVVIDTAPRQFRAKTRPEFEKLDGRVGVDSGTIAFANASDVPALPDGLSVSFHLAPGTYRAWSEHNENSFADRRTILAVGPTVQLFLAGADATNINEIETQVAKAIRMKGEQRIKLVSELQQRIVDLHMQGCRDQRLKMLADAVKLTLPRRPRTKSK
ncbi:MAG: hypothetical protein F9B45_32000 [Phycisphaera sp. RhM]|nr:hypothetical protein [Phycisphaera sp. RhM]